MAPVVDEQHDVDRMIDLLRGQPDPKRAVGHPVERRRRADCRLAAGVGQHALDLAAAGARPVHAAVDHHLGRVDVALGERAGVGALPLGGFPGREAVLPADVVPVVDVERQRHDVGPLRELAELGIGRGAGAAALRGEQLDGPRAGLAFGPRALDPVSLSHRVRRGQQGDASDQNGTSSKRGHGCKMGVGRALHQSTNG